MTYSYLKTDSFLFDWFEDNVLSNDGALERDDMGRTVGVYDRFAIVSASTKAVRSVRVYPDTHAGHSLMWSS